MPAAIGQKIFQNKWETIPGPMRFMPEDTTTGEAVKRTNPCLKTYVSKEKRLSKGKKARRTKYHYVREQKL